MGPLAKSVDNPNYFAKPDGTPVYLTGSHHWDSIQDEGESGGSLLTFDFTAYLNWTVAQHYNFMRLWLIGETATLAASDANRITDPVPWNRSGTTGGFDGNQFDLTSFNTNYFDRLVARVSAAHDAGVYVSVMLFEGWSLNPRVATVNPWPAHPFKSGNNINSVNGDPSNSGFGDTLRDATNIPTAALNAEHDYVKHVIDLLHGYNNVLYEISNEDTTGSGTWQNDMVTFIKNYYSSQGYGNPPPIGMNSGGADGIGNAALMASNADFISPDNQTGGYNTTPSNNDGTKVVISDTDHTFGFGGDIQLVWRSFTRGLNFIMMDDLGYTGISGAWGAGGTPSNDPGYTARLGMTETADYAARMNLKNAVPHGELCTTGFALVEPGVRYLCYAPTGGSFTVDLSSAVGHTFNVEWLDVTNNTTSSGGTVSGGSATEPFTAPTSPAVLFLY